MDVNTEEQVWNVISRILRSAVKNDNVSAIARFIDNTEEYQRDYSAAGAQIANHAVGLYVRVVRQQESVRAEAVILGNVHRKRSQGEGFSLHIIAFLSCDLSDDYLPVGVNDVLAFCGVHKH